MKRGVGLTIARAGELIVWSIWALGVSCFCANGASNGWLKKVARVRPWWVRILARLANIVHIIVVSSDTTVRRGLGQWALDVVVAGVIRRLTISVRAGRSALCQRWSAFAVVGICESGVLGRGDDGFVRVVVSKVNVRFLLQRRVNPAIVDTQSNELDILAFDSALGDGSVL